MNTPKSIISSASIIVGAFIYSSTLFYGIDEGKKKTVIILLILPIILLLINVLFRVTNQTIIMTLLFLYWLPIRAYFFSNLYLFELAIWLFLFFKIFNHLVDKRSDPPLSLYDLPINPFLLYITGALISYLITDKTGPELNIIRLLCIFPLVLSMVIHSTIHSVEDAEKYLWILLISTAVVGLLFLLGDKLFSFVGPTEYLAGSGRRSMELRFPHLDVLMLTPASTSCLFSIIIPFAYGSWLVHDSGYKKACAGVTCLICGLVMIVSQGRAGMIAAIVTISIYSYWFFRQKQNHRYAILLWYGLILLVIIGGSWYLSINSENNILYERIFNAIRNPRNDLNYIGRSILLKENLITFFEKPWGIGLFGLTDTAKGDTWNVHNLWLWNALSFGIIGLIGYVWILLTYLKVFLRQLYNPDPRKRSFAVMGTVSIIGTIIMGQFGALAWDPYSVVIVWAPLAISYSALTLDRRKATV